MGIIDTKQLTIKCNKCGLLGHARIHDKGNRFSGSDWQSRGRFEGFNSEWHQDASGSEPELIRATCNQCGGEASVIESRYTQ